MLTFDSFSNPIHPFLHVVKLVGEVFKNLY